MSNRLFEFPGAYDLPARCSTHPYYGNLTVDELIREADYSDNPLARELASRFNWILNEAERELYEEYIKNKFLDRIAPNRERDT